MRIAAPIAAVVMALLAESALSASSEWFETEGARMRLVTAGAPGEDGKLKGALEIALEPGWKTYWRDPGEAGVPPQIGVARSTNIADVEIEFPPPQRFDDGYSVWAGYGQPVALPVTFTLAIPEQAAMIEADLFLGICKEVCVPVQARLSLDPRSTAGYAEHAQLVASAHAALPAEAKPGFRVGRISSEGSALVARVELPESPSDPELFVQAPDGWVLGTPIFSGGSRPSFSIPIVERPSGADAKARLRYTLVAAEGAVDGVAELP
jgi:DsbC/DsbD-like thiol-disulfide interchange protein